MPLQTHKSPTRLADTGTVSRELRRDPPRCAKRTEGFIPVPGPELGACQLDEVMGAPLRRHRERWLPPSGQAEHGLGVSHLGCCRDLMYPDARRAEGRPVVGSIGCVAADVALQPSAMRRPLVSPHKRPVHPRACAWIRRRPAPRACHRQSAARWPYQVRGAPSRVSGWRRTFPHVRRQRCRRAPGGRWAGLSR